MPQASMMSTQYAAKSRPFLVVLIALLVSGCATASGTAKTEALIAQARAGSPPVAGKAKLARATSSSIT